MTERCRVILQGPEASYRPSDQAEYVKRALSGIDYPATVSMEGPSLVVVVRDPAPEYEDGVEELTEKLNEAGVLAYVEGA